MEYLTASPLARDSSATINPQSAIRNPQSAIRNPQLTLSPPVCYGCRAVMQSGLRFNLMRPSRLRRGIVIFFLIFTGAELVFDDMLGPQLCCEARAESSVDSGNIDASEKLFAKGFSASVSIESQSSRRRMEPTVLDDDCFCCCSNVIPGVSIIVAVMNDPPQPGALMTTPLPKAPPRNTFHPPRLSSFSSLTS
jgi:hypothetical protein